MTLTATDAKKRFGQVLEMAQKQPVFIEMAGRRRSVVMSVERHDQPVAAAAGRAGAATPATPPPQAKAFYDPYKDRVDRQNERVEQYGVFGEQYRVG